MLSATHDRYARAIRDAGLLFQVTGEQRYARRVREILLAYAGRYLDLTIRCTTPPLSQDLAVVGSARKRSMKPRG